VTNPNCSTIVLTMALAPLKQFGITRVIATTMQAISGAGYPGVPSMDINGQRDSLHRRRRREDAAGDAEDPGRFRGDHIEPLAAKVSAHCNRVPVVDGHTVTVSVELSAKPTKRRSAQGASNFPQRSAGAQSAQRAAAAGASICTKRTGRSRARTRNAIAGWRRSSDDCAPARCFDWKFVALGHNTIRGAAGAAVLECRVDALGRDCWTNDLVN
jgi:aspartate-semialdehyde dehydrogenase